MARTAARAVPVGPLPCLRRAQELLRAANLTVTEVCMLVGFSCRVVLVAFRPAGAGEPVGRLGRPATQRA